MERFSVSQSVSFLWEATPYPVTWAELAEEVPVWDVSRGFPLYRGFTDDREVSSWFGFNDDYDYEALVVEGKNISEPLPLNPFHYPPICEEAPSYPGAYPRLVRSEANRGYYERKPYLPLDVVNRLNSIGKLAEELIENPEREVDRLAPRKKTRKMIAKIAGELGYLKIPKGDTLLDWLSAAIEVSAHLKMLAWLDKSKKEPNYTIRNFFCDVAREYSKQWHKLKIGRPENRLRGSRTYISILEEMRGDFPWGDYPLPDAYFFHVAKRAFASHLLLSDAYEVVLTTSNSESPRAIREGVSNQLMKRFNELATNNVIFSTRGLILNTGVYPWAIYGLALAWAGKIEMAVCVCGKPFLKRQKNQKYCDTGSSKCRVKKWTLTHTDNIPTTAPKTSQQRLTL